MIRGLLIVVAVLQLLPAIASAQTLAEYRQALADTIHYAEAARLALPADAPLSEHAPFDQALSHLELISGVSMDSGAVVSLDNKKMITQLHGGRGEARLALQDLRRLLAALDASTEKSDWTGDGEPRASLDKVLSRPEFNGASTNPVASFIDDVRTRLFNWLGSMFPGVSIPWLSGLDLGKPVEVLFYLLAGASAIFAIVFFAFSWHSSRQSLAKYAALRPGEMGAREDSSSARLAALQAAERGEYRRAVHFLYKWAMLHLAEKSRMRYDQSLTNREQLRVVEDREVADLLKVAVEAFDRVWYGHAPCTADEYGRFRRVVERIVEASF